MKANRSQIEGALRASDPETRFFLLHGPDEAGSRALGKRLVATMGAEAERVDMAGADLKGDPARLADEAASISLFGGRRYIWVEPAGEEALEAVEALARAPVAGNPVLIIAGALKPSSRLLKLALDAPCALAFASYVPDGREADALVLELARDQGLALRPELARRLAEASGGNRALIEQELAKIALFVDAAPERPQRIDQDVLDAVGASSEEGSLGRLVDSVGNGDAATLEAELARLSGEGIEGIPLIRALLRRMTMLARLRSDIDGGKSVDAVMASQGKAVFWKEKPVIAQQLGRWRSELLAKAIARLLEAERQVKAPGGLGPLAVDEELFAICRQAARLR